MSLPSLFFFNDTATTEIYTLSLHDALPIYQRHAAGIATEVDRGEIGVRRDHGDVEGVETQHFRDDDREHRVRALADLGRPAEHRHAAAPVALELHPRVRHRVPVDRESGARNVGGAGEPHALSVGELAVLLLPLRSRDDLAKALGEAHRADAQ